MEIREIAKREAWESFLENCKEKTFVDSWSWGEFQKSDGHKIWRYGVFDGNFLQAVFLVIKIKAKRGTFLFVPHGPNVKNLNNIEVVCNAVFDELKRLARKEKAIFVRIAPIFERSDKNSKVFRDFGFKTAPIHMHPEVTWELDIALSEEELQKGMRKTTRYLVKQAEKNPDIEIIKSQDIKDLALFNKVYLETVKRHSFVPFSLNYLENQFNCFSGNNEIEILLGKYKGKIVSAAIIIYWQGTGFYHHGASLGEFNNNKTPVSYLLQWEAIKEAKKRGCQLYNFWGIAPEIKDKEDAKNSRHPWAGLSLFKMGFGGRRKDYVKTQDMPISAFYWVVRMFEILRKKKRGL